MASLGTIVRGDDEVIELTIKNANGAARDISTDTFVFTVKQSKYDVVPLVQKSLGSGIVKTNTAAGLIEVSLDEDDLEILNRERTLYCEIEVTDSGGKTATTPFTVEFVLDLN
jgi:hypothetical protein